MHTGEMRFSQEIKNRITDGFVPREHIDPLSENPHLWTAYLHAKNWEFNVPPKHNQPIFVMVNHGRWVATCPWCNSAQLAFTEDRWFLCSDCLNSACGGQSVEVKWPDDESEIEKILSLRPDVSTQNWVWGETVDGLIRENEEHGVS